MKDLLKDILETSRDRIKTPITGSFALAFLLWNWQPILVLLLSDNSIEDRIKYINKNDCTAWALLAPLLIAIGYVTLVPYIMVGLEWLTKFAIGKRKNYRTKQQKDDLIAATEIATEEFKLAQARSGQRDIGALNERINELNSQIETQNAQHKKQIENLNEQYKAQVENYEKAIMSYKDDSSEYNGRIGVLENQIDYKNEELEILLKISGIKNILDELTPDEQHEYYDLYKDSSNGFIKIDTYFSNKKSINKFILLNLIRNEDLIDDVTYKITELGKNLYQYLEKTIFPF